MDDQVAKKDQPKVPGKPLMPEELPEAPPARTQPRRSIGGFLLGVIILILLGFAVYRVIGPSPSTPPRANRATASQSVGVATIGKGNIRIIFNGLGTVTPLATITVKTQINGRLTEVGFQEGQIVKKGDFLAQIDPRPFQLAEQQFEGQLAHDQGLLNQARLDLNRYQTLVKQNSIARQTAEDQAFLVTQYEGSVKTDQAQIDTQKLDLIYCHIIAPVTGRIGLRLVDPGNYVQTTDTTGLAVVTQIQPISVIFSLAEDNIPLTVAQMKTGTPLSATAFDRANLTELATGTVATIDNVIDTTTGMVKFRAIFQNADEALFPNQFVNVRVLIQTHHDVVTAPNAAIQRGAPGTYVYVVNDDNTVSVRSVKLGPGDGGMVEIVSGLNPGDRVVIDGTDLLRDGAHVTMTANQTEKAGVSNSPADGHTPSGGTPGQP
jgi:multidrug efflux system membrane fusion protein